MDNPWIGRAVLLAAALLAVVSARPYAGGWNDGSRLATVECLVDHGTLAIDNSVFVRPPSSTGPRPYAEHDALLRKGGTLDKLLINGHYYSDKSPVPALMLAGVYGVWRTAGGPSAAERPDLFCLLLTVASSGLAYVAAVGCIASLGRALGLPTRTTLLLTASFALATVALPYARHVNNHLLLLGVTAGATLTVVRWAGAGWRGPLVLGALAGLGYTIDLGVGPVLLMGSGLFVLVRGRRVGPVVVFTVAALPWLLLHHAVNYAVGGTLAPANAVAEYLLYPGSPFTEATMTGGWKHSGVGRFAWYALSLLIGQRGFLGHNLALFLLLPALSLLRRPLPERGPLLFAMLLGVGVWLMYAVNSNNYSGRCLSIRWFVPLLAPGYLLVAVVLRERPRLLGDFLVLSAWGLAVAALGWWLGPWERISEMFLWPIRIGTLLSWLGYRLGRAWARSRALDLAEQQTQPPLAA